MSATSPPTMKPRMAMAQTQLTPAISAIAPHSMMSPNLPHGSPGTDIVRVFCAHIAGLSMRQMFGR